MGRGLGQLQRNIVEVLADRSKLEFEGERYWYSDFMVGDVTRAIFGPGYTDSNRRNVARAISTLEQRGLVYTFRVATHYTELPGGRRIPKTVERLVRLGQSPLDKILGGERKRPPGEPEGLVDRA